MHGNRAASPSTSTPPFVPPQLEGAKNFPEHVVEGREEPGGAGTTGLRAAASGEKAESQTRKSVVKHPSSNAAREHHKCQPHKPAFKRGKMLIRGRGVMKPPGRGETAWRRSERPIMREEAASHSPALSTGPESKPQTQAGLQLWYQGHCGNQGLTTSEPSPGIPPRAHDRVRGCMEAGG